MPVLERFATPVKSPPMTCCCRRGGAFKSKELLLAGRDFFLLRVVLPDNAFSISARERTASGSSGFMLSAGWWLDFFLMGIRSGVFD
jgi:hypothetical protein